VEVNVGFKRYEAQRLAATVLAYIRAWDVHRIMVHQLLVGRPAPYLLTTTTAIAANTTTDAGDMFGRDATDPDYPQEAPASGANGVQVSVPAQPATSAAIAATAEAIYGPGDLRYGDGSAVNENNSFELQTLSCSLPAKSRS